MITVCIKVIVRDENLYNEYKLCVGYIKIIMGFLFKIKISFCCLLLMLFSISCLIEMETGIENQEVTSERIALVTNVPESSQLYRVEGNTSVPESSQLYRVEETTSVPESSQLYRVEENTSVSESSESYILNENTSKSSVTFDIVDSHPQHECLNLDLNRFVDVFGVYVISHSSIPDEYILHTAKILAEYIDNDIDGVPDDMKVLTQLLERNYVMPVWTETLREKTFESVRTYCEDDIGFAASMYYGGDKWALNGIIYDGTWDGNLEEVWHVVSSGWYKAYPEYFGDGYDNQSVLSYSMDLARGGKFKETPDIYPDDAWYSYDDKTCGYGCQIHEYFYWALMANIGALDSVYTNKCESSEDEWRICAQDELFEIDRSVYDLLNDERFKLPKNIPQGNYPLGESKSSNSVGDSHEEVDSLINFEWMTDSVVTYEESAFINNLRILEDQLDPEAYLDLVSSSWMSDPIKDDEYMLLYYLHELWGIGLTSMVNQIIQMPFIQQSYEPHDALALRTLYRLNLNFPVIYTDIIDSDWFQDGVNDDESILLQVLGTNSEPLNSEDLKYFVVNHEISTSNVNLPIGGLRSISFIQSGYSKKNLDVVDQVHEAVAEIESFMNIPFPKEEIIMLFANKDQVPDRINWIGINFGDHMVMLPTLAKGKDENTTVVHEVAHYYWNANNAPLWFREGMADFLATYVRDKLGRETFAERFAFSSGATSLEKGIQGCNSLGVKTIKKLVDLLNQDGYAIHSESKLFLCNYYLGEWLLTQIYDLLGPDDFADVIGALYSTDTLLDDNVIYEAFLGKTTDTNRTQFKELYESLYGEL